MEQILEWLSMPEVQTAVLAVTAFGFGLVKRLEAVHRWQLERALACLEAGVRETYAEYVRATKAAHEDGKLTDAEREEALRRALDRARAYAAAEGVDLLKHYAKVYLPVLVEKIVRRNKTEAALPFAFSAGPELDF